MSPRRVRDSDRREAERGEQPLSAHPGIDLQRLADKVYRLMLDDIRLTQARGGQVTRRRKF